MKLDKEKTVELALKIWTAAKPRVIEQLKKSLKENTVSRLRRTLFVQGGLFLAKKNEPYPHDF